MNTSKEFKGNNSSMEIAGIADGNEWKMQTKMGWCSLLCPIESNRVKTILLLR